MLNALISRKRQCLVAASCLAAILASQLLGATAGARDRSAHTSAVDRLSPAQLVGQRVILSYQGPNPPDALFDQIRMGQAAGVIFFGHNITSRQQIAEVVVELQEAAEHSILPPALRRPLLLMTDQEGGIVRRLPGPPDLTEEQIGASPESKLLARQAGFGAGLNLGGVGMNVNLAPVLGVLSNPANFLEKFGRLYGSNPRKVARLGGAFISAQQRQGVAATAKHFPGLGAAGAEDTDSGPVTLDIPLHTLRTVDELPYPTAIEAGTRLVMISNATYPALDPTRPASLSAAVMRSELRGRLGFRGVTITDALEAGGLEDFGTVPHRGVLAARAGADLLLFSGQDVNEGIAGYQQLLDTFSAGTMDLRRFEGSVRRVLRLRKALTLGTRLPPP